MIKQNIRIVLIGIMLILLQTFLQNNQAFQNIATGIIDSVRPFIYAVFIAILVTPLVNYFENKMKIKRVLSIVISLIIIFIIIIGLILVIVPSIFESITELIDKFPEMLSSLNDNSKNLIAYLEKRKLLFFNIDEIEAQITNLVRTNLVNLKNILFNVGSGILSSIFGLVNFFIGLFISLYLINDKEYFMNLLEKVLFLFTTEEDAKRGVVFVNKVNSIFFKYILGRILTSAIVGIVVFVILYFAKVPYAILSAVMIGLGNMIPYIGSIVAGVISTFLILMVSPIKVIILFIAIGIGQFVDGFIVGPKIMAESVGISSFWSIISVLICGNLFGPIGMFLGVPLFAVIKLIYVYYLEKKEKKFE